MMIRLLHSGEIEFRVYGRITRIILSILSDCRFRPEISGETVERMGVTSSSPILSILSTVVAPSGADDPHPGSSYAGSLGAGFLPPGGASGRRIRWAGFTTQKVTGI